MDAEARAPEWERFAEEHRRLARREATLALALVVAGGVLLVAAFTVLAEWQLVPLALGALAVALAWLLWVGYEENVERAEGIEALAEEWRAADDAARGRLRRLLLRTYGR